MGVKRIIITGAPGCGKSTLLLNLGKRGFQVMPETYRWLKVIEGIESFSYLDNQKQLSDDQFLFHLALQKFLDDQPSDEIEYCFYDRSLIDVVAYCHAYKQSKNLEFSKLIAEATSKHIYCAFLLPTPGCIEQDIFRKEDFRETQRLYNVIKDTYNKFGIRLIKLNKKNPLQCADEIINYLNQF